VSGLFLGATDAALSAQGRAEANKLGNRLAGQDIAGIICSDLQRARDTAVAVAMHHPNLELQVDARIREMHLGDLEGVPAKEAQAAHPELMKQWFDDPGNTRMPGEHAESLGEVQTRAWTAIEDFAKANSGQTIAAVSHTFCILSTLCHVLGMPLTQFRRMFIHRASITEIVWDKHGPVLRRFNDVAHLE
jgi:probable phosphoglycerate mutase